jgi:hypothetical protein
VEPRPLPDLLMYFVLQVAEGSDLSAKHEVDHQLRVLRERPADYEPPPAIICWARFAISSGGTSSMCVDTFQW